MEKGKKGKEELEREVRRWLGSGSERPRVLTFHLHGMDVSENSRGTSQFQVRRYVYKKPSLV